MSSIVIRPGAIAAAALLWPLLAAAGESTKDIIASTIELTVVREEFDGTFCWFHPRVAAIPGAGSDGRPAVIMTLQKHLLPGDDFYSGLFTMRSDDLGATWTGPVEQEGLGWREEPGGVTWGVANVTPGWHAPTARLIAIGSTVRYKDGVLTGFPQPSETGYATFDPKTGVWAPWRTLDMPDQDKFISSGAGCTQWLVDEDGSLLVPIYFYVPSEHGKGSAACASSTVVRCAFDGAAMTCIEHGDELHLDIPRGFDEPSLVRFRGKYYLTIRNDERGYVTTGDDGLHFQTPKPWAFDDGSELGSYNTQQHWLTSGGGLFLVYTRRGANNDHIFRHRAPLFMAQVDPDTLCVLRATERAVVPERGATLGNFGVARITDAESWITVGEGMFFPDVYKKGGARGAVFAARVIEHDAPKAAE